MAGENITFESVHQAYLEYADYEEVNDVSRARKFSTAIKRMVSFAQSSSNLSSSMSFDIRALQDERKRAEAFISANDTEGGLSESGLNCFGFNGYER